MKQAGAQGCLKGHLPQDEDLEGVTSWEVRQGRSEGACKRSESPQSAATSSASRAVLLTPLHGMPAPFHFTLRGEHTASYAFPPAPAHVLVYVARAQTFVVRCVLTSLLVCCLQLRLVQEFCEAGSLRELLDKHGAASGEGCTCLAALPAPLHRRPPLRQTAEIVPVGLMHRHQKTLCRPSTKGSWKPRSSVRRTQPNKAHPQRKCMHPAS